MFLWLKRLFKLFLYAALVFITVITLTSSLLGTALTGLVAATASLRTMSGSIPSVRARNLKLEAQLTKQRTAISRMGKRVIDRSKLMAARSVAKIPSSAIPFAGTVMLVSLTLIEFKQLCESLFDLKELYKEAELEEEVDADVLQTVCHPSGWFTDDVEEQ